jgi:hypothetical protein
VTFDFPRDGIDVQHFVEVQNADAVTTGQGAGNVIQSKRIHRVGSGQRIG